jgi:hypothetical protein
MAPIDIVPPLGIATFTAIAGGSLNPILSKESSDTLQSRVGLLAG